MAKHFFIIIPVYNSEKYLDRCIQSVLSQDYHNYDIILVNDGSTDQSGSICDKYGNKHSNVIVLHQDNLGQIASRNHAIQYIKKMSINLNDSYLMFVDSDDTIKENSLSRISELLSCNNCDMLIFGIKRVYEDEGKFDNLMQGTYSGVVDSKSDLYRIVLFDNQYNSLCRKVVSASLISDESYEKYYCIRHGEDLVQSLNYYKKCKSVFFTQEMLYNYYMNSDSVTHTQCLSNFQISSLVRKETWDFIVKENVWDEKILKEYSKYNMKLLSNKIINISLADGDFQSKKELFEQIFKDCFYGMIISNNKKYSCIMDLFAHKHYRLTIALVNLRQFILDAIRPLRK